MAARRVQSVTVPSSRVSRECRSSGLRSPSLKNARYCADGSQKSWKSLAWTENCPDAQDRTLAALDWSPPRRLLGVPTWSLESPFSLTQIPRFWGCFPPRGPCEVKIVSPLSRDNSWLAITLARIVSWNASQTVSCPQERAFFLFQNNPRGEGNCETSERQKMSRGNFCPATSRCLFWPVGLTNLCSERHVAQLDLILTLFWPIPTYFDHHTYLHLVRPISFHNKTPWTGRLSFPQNITNFPALKRKVNPNRFSTGQFFSCLAPLEHSCSPWTSGQKFRKAPDTHDVRAILCLSDQTAPIDTSPWVPFKPCVSLQARDQNINWANLYENETASTNRDLNCSGASPKKTHLSIHTSQNLGSKIV